MTTTAQTASPRADAAAGRTPLSVLDTAMIGHSAERALADGIALAQHAERLGLSRYWCAEHHGRTAGAGTAPVVTATAIAGATATITVGSGGVMIPNHVPLVVAEQFATLAALHPGRVDLGVGRAAPPDPATAAVLGHYLRDHGADDFADRVDQLVGFLTGTFPSGRQLGDLFVAPRAQQPPTVWVLGTSPSAAALAAALGLPFAFGRGDAASALAHYRATFTPSATLDRPYAMVTLLSVVAPTHEQASLAASSADLYFHRFFTTGRAPSLLPSVQEVAEHPWSADERALAAGRRAGQAVGDPAHAGAVIEDLLRSTGADEVMLTSQMHALEDRVRSLELVASLPSLATASLGQSAWPHRTTPREGPPPCRDHLALRACVSPPPSWAAHWPWPRRSARPRARPPSPPVRRRRPLRPPGAALWPTCGCWRSSTSPPVRARRASRPSPAVARSSA